ncbi:hypothetical protein FE257_002470 [Aspergillus nanangensis]|uniref:Uncharacterized protein n=1 Tax=Aspergillus nanangensis TaxID=2582783 RepID=A0AAD4GVU4_ASPNN|nr:hypothetical protein FE257_002470 [Aspergillus nanangensis]
MSELKPSRAYSRSSHHKRLQDLAADLKKAVNDVCPKIHRYGKVSVLAFHWENDTMGVAELETELLQVFKRIYSFFAESYTIPIIGSVMALNIKLNQWTICPSITLGDSSCRGLDHVALQ